MNVQPEAPDHPKFLRLKRRIGPLAAEVLWRLWGHCAQNQRGPIWAKPKANSEYVEMVCRWDGEAGSLYAALTESGWVKETQDAVVVHDWEVYNSKMTTAWENARLGGRRPTGPQNPSPANRNRDSVPRSGNPTQDSVPATETESATGVHRVGLGRVGLGTRREGGSGAVALSEEPVIPSALEVVTFGSMSSGIPADYCEDYHLRKTIARTWLNFRGELIDWRREIVSWWPKKKPTWGQKTGRGNLTELQAISDELEWQTDPAERERLKKRRAELGGSKAA